MRRSQMAKIAPFRGVRYNPQRFEKLDLTVSLPYDRIKGDLQERYYQLDEHNIVRIIKGKAFPGDTETDNQYTRAGKFYESGSRKASSSGTPNRPSTVTARNSGSLPGSSPPASP